MSKRVLHLISPYEGNSPLFQRQQLFLESVELANRQGVVLIAGVEDCWQKEGWETRPLQRNSRIFGGNESKPFLKDLYNLGLQFAEPEDWLLYTNTDCAFLPGLYEKLFKTRGTVVEYMRHDVEDDPNTLKELLSNERHLYTVGLDGMALRADFYSEIQGLLPDFVIGEPHWDTIYSDILRSMVPVIREKEMLYHPKHEQVWHLGYPTPSGEHNHQLFVDALTFGRADRGLIRDEPNETDTAVIVVSFGEDVTRIRANIEGIREQLKQDLYCDYYLVELLHDKMGSAYSAELLSNIHHFPVYGSLANQDIFQKESLMNYGWRAALKRHRYDYFVFIDADIYSEQRNWFRLIRDRLKEKPSRAVQGYRIARDTKDPAINYNSLASAYALQHQTDLTLNPGLCWALHRSVLEMGDGFNSDCIECAGDSVFVAEYLNWDCYQYDPWLDQFHWFHEIVRNLPFRAELDCVPVDIVHVHHGYLTERNYDGVRYAIDNFRPIHELLGHDNNGLLFWKEPDCIERKLLQQQHRMGSRESVDGLFGEFGLDRYVRKDTLKKSERITKPLFPVASEKKRTLVPLYLPTAVKTKSSQNRLNIFDPKIIFRDDFPFSWCDYVKKKEGRTFIPIAVNRGFPVLVLDGLAHAKYIVGCLPIQPSWEPFDLSKFTTLHFRIWVSEEMASDVKVLLVSKTGSGLVNESQAISLVERGVAPSMFEHFSVPLSDFSKGDEFLLSQTRLLKFIGQNSFRMELASIYID